MLPFKEMSRSQADGFNEGDAFSCFLPSNDDFDLSEEDKLRLQGLTIPIPENEARRLQVLRQTKLLDSDRSDASFNRFTDLAKRFFKVPLVLISLVDIERQWFKSTAGELDAAETPRNLAFCAYTVLPRSPDVFVVEDSHKDARFKDNALVTGPPFVRFYAGAALVVDNVKVGSLCLLDQVAHPGFTAKDRMNLLDLGAAVASLIEERRSVALNQNQERAKMMLALMHNLRTPLTALHMAASMLTDENMKNRSAANNPEEKTLRRKDSIREMSLNELKESVGQLKVLIESSLSLGQIIVDKSTRPPSPTGPRDDGDRDHEGSGVGDRAPPLAAISEATGHLENLAASGACNVLDAVRDARKVLGHHESVMNISWDIDAEGYLSEGNHVCLHRVLYFVILRSIDLFASTWTKVDVQVQFKRTNKIYDSLDRKAKLVSPGKEIVYGVVHVNFTVSKPKEDDIPLGELDVYSIEQILVDSEGGARLTDLGTPPPPVGTTAGGTGDADSNNRDSSVAGGVKLECWLPCGVVMAKKLPPAAVGATAALNTIVESSSSAIIDVTDSSSGTRRASVVTASSRATPLPGSIVRRKSSFTSKTIIPSTIEVPVTPLNEPAVAGASSSSSEEEVASYTDAPATTTTIATTDAASLPLTTSKSKSKGVLAPDAVVAAAPGPLRVILVEDCVSIQKLMSRWLKSKDCVVTLASNGKIGYQYLTTQPFDICFMDFLMPVQLGVDTIKYFHEWMNSSPEHNINSQMLMIGLSANATSTDLDEGFDHGMHFFCQKPAETELLGSIIHAKRTASTLYEVVEMINERASPQIHVQRSEDNNEECDGVLDKEKKWKIVTSLKTVKE